MAKLFPPYLNEGAKGPAVVVLQLLIQALEGPSTEVEADGDYTVGGKTGDSVAAFQLSCGLDPDRNFGPETRAKFYSTFGIDVDALSAEDFVGDTTSPELSDGALVSAEPVAEASETVAVLVGDPD